MQGPSDPTAAFADLIVRHGEQAVVESRIGNRDADGHLVLQPFLAAPDVGIVILRDSLTGDFRDIMTEAGCVRSSHPPLFEIIFRFFQHGFICL